MTALPQLADAKAQSGVPSHDDWVLDLSIRDKTGAKLIGGSFSSRGSVQAFFDGILFDRADLASSVGCHEPDPSPADLVILAYQRWGMSAFSRLRGIFAVAVIDQARREAIVARDPLGSHPLFYTQIGSRVLFGSKAQTLISQPGVSCDLNAVCLADAMCHRWPEPSETYFAAVRRMPPGSRAILSDDGLQIERYWDPLPPNAPVEYLNEREVGRFDELLDRAVDRCTSTGPTAIFLSGGLDSISIAAMAAEGARRQNRPLPWALSLGFPDPGCDERLVQASVARELGLTHHLIGFHETLGPRGLLVQSLELNRDLAAPIINTWAPAYLSLIRMSRLDGLQTILTGSGGDEWLSVTPYLAADLIRQRDFVGFARFAHAWQRSYRLSRWRLLRSALWTYGLRPLSSMALHRLAPRLWEKRRGVRSMRNDPAWVAPDSGIKAKQRQRAASTLFPADPPQGFYLQEVRTGLDHPLTSLELEEQHELGRRVGVRFMHPYWDADLVDLLYRTPPHLLNQGGRSKGLVRETLSRRFPKLGFERQRKVTGTTFYRSLLRNEGPAIVESLGGFHALGALGVIDARAARAFVDQAFAIDGLPLYRCWDLLNLETWARAHLA